MKIEDQLPNGLEYVKDSLKAEGNEPNPVELKEEAEKLQRSMKILLIQLSVALYLR